MITHIHSLSLVIQDSKVLDLTPPSQPDDQCRFTTPLYKQSLRGWRELEQPGCCLFLANLLYSGHSFPVSCTANLPLFFTHAHAYTNVPPSLAGIHMPSFATQLSHLSLLKARHEAFSVTYIRHSHPHACLTRILPSRENMG